MVRLRWGHAASSPAGASQRAAKFAGPTSRSVGTGTERSFSLAEKRKRFRLPSALRQRAKSEFDSHACNQSVIQFFDRPGSHAYACNQSDSPRASDGARGGKSLNNQLMYCKLPT